MIGTRVFILYSHGLFARGVQSLLGREQGVQVVGMERDGHQALDQIRRLRPDVILVDFSAQGDHDLTISGIFQEIPEARVVSLSLQGNDMDVYDKQRIIASSPEDLLRVLKRGSAAASTMEAGEATTPGEAVNRGAEAGSRGSAPGNSTQRLLEGER